MKKNFYIVFGVLLIADTTFHIINTLYFRSSKSLINGTTIIKSSMNSYFSLKNIAFKEDNGTRVYIEPAAKTDKNSSTINESGNIVSGVGGVLKIFGDAYSEGANYRDLGIYFHANQKGDIGFNKTGNFFINSKVNGVHYKTGNETLSPDIVFSFQDGKTIAGRFIHTDATGKKKPYTYSTLYMGSNLTPSSKNSYAVKLFESFDEKIRNNIAIEIAPNGAIATPSLVFTNKNINKAVEYSINEKDELNQIILNKTTETMANTYNIKHVKEWNSTVQEIKTGESFIVNANLVIFNGSKSFTIKNINGNVGTGFEVTLIFKNNKTTISTKGNIKIIFDITPKKNSTLTLIRVDNIWVEKSRSIL